MKKILFLNASAQNGVCLSAIEAIQQNFWLEYSTEVVSLRDYDIEQCTGCMLCLNSSTCPIEDKLHILTEKIVDSDIVVVATPSYFYNVSGLLKTYIDRSRELLHSKALYNKKFIYIYCAHDNPDTVKPYLDTALFGFNYCHHTTNLGAYCIQVNNDMNIKDETGFLSTISKITDLINANI